MQPNWSWKITNRIRNSHLTWLTGACLDWITGMLSKQQKVRAKNLISSCERAEQMLNLRKVLGNGWRTLRRSLWYEVRQPAKWASGRVTCHHELGQKSGNDWKRDVWDLGKLCRALLNHNEHVQWLSKVWDRWDLENNAIETVRIRVRRTPKYENNDKHDCWDDEKRTIFFSFENWRTWQAIQLCSKTPP